MGNCCGRVSSSSTVWAGDEWESLATAEEEEDEQPPFDKQRLLRHLKATTTSSPSSMSPASRDGSTTEVKIKITKKELEELLGKAEMQNLSTEQVLERIISASEGRYTVHHHDEHHWRPGLSSIPEVN